MTEEQADKIIDLLEQIKSETENVSSAIMLWSDSGDVVNAINDLRSDLARRPQ